MKKMSQFENAYIRQVVLERSGNQVPLTRDYLIESRVAPIASDAGFDSLHEFVAYLEQHATSPWNDVVAEAMTINETSFFRDNVVFDALRTQILPQIASNRSAPRRVDIWSAACASGQESYSLALTAVNTFALKDFVVPILASDISDRMLTRTREGIYSSFEVARGLTGPMRDRFFVPVENAWQINRELRSMIDARRVNLTLLPIALGKFDLILLRNVLLYFDRKTKQQILQSLRRHVRDDGYLFLGGGETIIGLDIPFRRELISGAVCYRPV